MSQRGVRADYDNASGMNWYYVTIAGRMPRQRINCRYQENISRPARTPVQSVPAGHHGAQNQTVPTYRTGTRMSML
jgi:hypothetical protein